MKIFSPNIKLVEELTKYISPASIEKARFKKYNSPIINDGNLLCDEFFRAEEQFNKKLDSPVFQPYSIDDLPICKSTTISSLDIQKLSNCNSANVENNLPYYVDIIGEKNKRIYLEQYGTKNPKHPHVEMFNADNIWNNRELYQNRTVDEVVNIRYYTSRLSIANGRGLEYEALSLLKKDYPLEYVIYIMKQSVLKTPYVRCEASPGLMKFLSDYPDMRRYVVTHNDQGEEVFDYYAAKMFPELLEVCNDDLKLLNQILWDCRMPMNYNSAYLTKPNILKTGISLYKIDNSWNEQKVNIIEELIKNKTLDIENVIYEIEDMIYQNKPLDCILDKITSKRLGYKQIL